MTTKPSEPQPATAAEHPHPQPISPTDRPTLVELDLDQIRVPHRMRPANKDAVELIAESITREGQLQPILCRQIADPETGELTAELIDGLHRMRAIAWLREQGYRRTTIQCLCYPVSRTHARAAEASANLCRSALTWFDRCAALARLHEIYQIEHPQTKRGGDRKSKAASQTPKLLAFAEAAAERLGLSARTIKRDLAFYNGLAPDLHELIQDHHAIANNPAALRGLVSRTNDFAEQRGALQTMLKDHAPRPPRDPRKMTVNDAIRIHRGQKKPPEPSKDDRDFSAFFNHWGRLIPANRERFLHALFVDGIFDWAQMWRCAPKDRKDALQAAIAEAEREQD